MDTPLNQAVTGPKDPNDNSSSAWFYYFWAFNFNNLRFFRLAAVPLSSPTPLKLTGMIVKH